MVDLLTAFVLVACGGIFVVVSPLALVPWFGALLFIVGFLCLMLAGRLVWEEVR